MTRDLKVMDTIQKEKEKELKAKGVPPMNQEGKTIAQDKRFTFDCIDTPIDPLR